MCLQSVSSRIVPLTLIHVELVVVLSLLEVPAAVENFLTGQKQAMKPTRFPMIFVVVMSSREKSLSVYLSCSSCLIDVVAPAMLLVVMVAALAVMVRVMAVLVALARGACGRGVHTPCVHIAEHVP